MQILAKVIEHQGKNWDLELPGAFWAYKTSMKTSAWFTPFHLVYGKEALMPVEVELPVVKMLEKLLGPSSDVFKERLLCLQEVQLDRVRALEHYEMMQDKALARENQKVKRKGIPKVTWFCDTIVSWIKPSKRSFKSNGKVPLKSWKVLLMVHISWQTWMGHCMPQG